jgi:hypothetical protein
MMGSRSTAFAPYSLPICQWPGRDARAHLCGPARTASEQAGATFATRRSGVRVPVAPLPSFCSNPAQRARRRRRSCGPAGVCTASTAGPGWRRGPRRWPGRPGRAPPPASSSGRPGSPTAPCGRWRRYRRPHRRPEGGRRPRTGPPSRPATAGRTAGRRPTSRPRPARRPSGAGSCRRTRPELAQQLRIVFSWPGALAATRPRPQGYSSLIGARPAPSRRLTPVVGEMWICDWTGRSSVHPGSTWSHSCSRPPGTAASMPMRCSRPIR